ncbi:MAG: hypothetical protein ACE5H0_07815, partial [Bacteroidota bacterium]
MRVLYQDIRYGFRQLMRSPGYTCLAVAVLALGIGPIASMFSVIYGVVFRPLPYEKSDQLVMIFRGAQSSGDKHYISAPVYCQWNEQQDSFEEIAAFRRFRFPIRNADGLISFAEGARV